MQDEKLKDNKALIVFLCDHKQSDECVYFFGKDGKCKFRKSMFYYCTSAVAQLNRMTLELKKLKGEK